MKINLVLEEVENRNTPSVFGAAPTAMNSCSCSTSTSTCTSCD